MSVAALLLVACGTPTPVPPQPTGASAILVRSAADLHCALPVVTPAHIGFVDFPSGRFSADPNAPSGDRSWLTYDYDKHQWMKIFYSFGNQLISPDGTEYVEANGGPIASGPGGPGGQGYTDIYAVSIPSTGMRRLGRVSGRARPIVWRPDGIYLDNGFIVRFDPTTGKSVELGPKGPQAANMNGGLWFWLTSTAAWYSLIAGPNQGDQNSIYSMSLKGGSLTKWLSAPAGRSVSIIGFVSPDEPLVVGSNTEPYTSMTGVRFMQLRKPEAPENLDFDSSINAWGFTDTMGVWLNSPGHLWLYDRAGPIPIADLSAVVGGELPGIAGPCR